MLWDDQLRSYKASPGGSTISNAKRALVFGGRFDGSGADTLRNDAWELWVDPNGSVKDVTWRQLVAPPTERQPLARMRPGAIFPPGTNQLLVVGGTLASSSTPCDTMWTLSMDGDSLDTFAPHWVPRATPAPVQAGALSATYDPDVCYARTAEIFHAATGQVDTLANVHLLQEWYPFNFVLPDGSIFNAGPSNSSYRLASSFDTQWATLPSTGSGLKGGSALMYRPGKVMKCGTRDTGNLDGNDRNAIKTTKTIDLTAASPSWTNRDSMHIARVFHNLTLLPNGQVLMTGGMSQIGNVNNVGPVYRPEIWDPDSGTWYFLTAGGDTLAADPVRRGYHSTTLLLPDGRVLCESGNSDDVARDSSAHTATIFSPPYLFFNDTLAWRARITGAADTIGWGGASTYTVPVDDTTGIRSACLIRPGAVTHAFDENQRFVPLAESLYANPLRVLVAPPADSNVTPPGYYLLFVNGSKDGSDVPSIARWVQVGGAGLDQPDVTPPKTISSLTAEVDPEDCTLFHLHWTAPADDSDLVASGRASSYEMKSSGFSFNSDWTGGMTLEHTPLSPGTTESEDITVGVNGNAYVRIKSEDNNHNWSWISNQRHIAGPGPNDDCLGDGMFAGGGGGGGASLVRARGAASIQPAELGTVTVAENSMMNGVAMGNRGEDAYRLPGLGAMEGGTVAPHIRVAAGHAAALDRVQLLAVDHPGELTPYRLGGSFLLGTRQNPTQITASDGLTATLDGSSTYSLATGDTLSVDLGTGGGASPLILGASGPGRIELLLPDSMGSWRTAEVARARRAPDELALPAPGSDRVRLTCAGFVNLSFVGRLAVSATEPSVQPAELLTARDGQAGDVREAVTASDSASATLVGPDTLALSYSTPALIGGAARDYFLIVTGTPLDPQSLPQAQLRATREQLPVRFALEQNRPNPFSGRTTIRFALPSASPVRLEVFDAAGRRIRTLALGPFAAGYHAADWDHRDAGGNLLRPGVYLYRLIAGSFRDQKKMVLLTK